MGCNFPLPGYGRLHVEVRLASDPNCFTVRLIGHRMFDLVVGMWSGPGLADLSAMAEDLRLSVLAHEVMES